MAFFHGDFSTSERSTSLLRDDESEKDATGYWVLVDRVALIGDIPNSWVMFTEYRYIHKKTPVF